jgi:hypothetical protein
MDMKMRRSWRLLAGLAIHCGGAAAGLGMLLQFTQNQPH